MDDNVSLLQSRIFLSSNQSNFRLTSVRQKLLIKSFCAKLKIIRDTLESDFINNFDKYFFVSYREKLVFAILLDFLNFPEYFYSVYIPKKNGLSFYFNLPNFFIICFENLFDLSFLPFVETKSDKFSYGFRPYRDCSDIFVQIKKSFFKGKAIFPLSGFEISTFLKDDNKLWILKNIPLKTAFLKKWLSTMIYKYDLFDNNLFLKFRGKLFFNIFNYMLNGLVWISNIL